MRDGVAMLTGRPAAPEKTVGDGSITASEAVGERLLVFGEDADRKGAELEK